MAIPNVIQAVGRPVHTLPQGTTARGIRDCLGEWFSVRSLQFFPYSPSKQCSVSFSCGIRIAAIKDRYIRLLRAGNPDVIRIMANQQPPSTRMLQAASRLSVEISLFGANHLGLDHLSQKKLFSSVHSPDSYPKNRGLFARYSANFHCDGDLSSAVRLRFHIVS